MPNASASRLNSNSHASEVLIRARVVIAAAALLALLGGGAMLLLGDHGRLYGIGTDGDADASIPVAGSSTLAAGPRALQSARRPKGSCVVFGSVHAKGADAKALAARVSFWQTVPYEFGRAVRGIEAAWNAEPRDATTGWPDATCDAGADGRFEIGGLTSGQYVVAAEAGPLRGVTWATVETDGGRTRCDIEVEPADLSLEVRAVRADGTPWRVRIAAASPARSVLADTDAAGTAAFRGLGAGDVDLDVFSAADGVRLGQTVTLPRSEPFVVTEPAGLVELSGRVIDATTGAPIAGADVSASATLAGMQVSGTRQSGPDGAFHVVAALSVSEVSARADGFADGTATLQGKATEITIAPSLSGASTTR